MPLWRRARREPAPADAAPARQLRASDVWFSSVVTFVDDDPGYHRWITSNPAGFVLNTSRTPSTRYLVLHRATCQTVTGVPARGATWTGGDYAKVCCFDRGTIVDWADDEVGAPPTVCGTCQP